MENDFKPDEYDRVGFILFNSALHHILNLNEGIVIEVNDCKFIVGKWLEDDKEVVGYKFEENNNFKHLKDGMFVWLDE